MFVNTGEKAQKPTTLSNANVETLVLPSTRQKKNE